jgi:hypothetical protein
MLHLFVSQTQHTGISACHGTRTLTNGLFGAMEGAATSEQRRMRLDAEVKRGTILQ